MADNWGFGEVDLGKWGGIGGELKICIYIPTPELYIHTRKTPKKVLESNS